MSGPSEWLQCGTKRSVGPSECAAQWLPDLLQVPHGFAQLSKKHTTGVIILNPPEKVVQIIYRLRKIIERGQDFCRKLIVNL